MASARISGRPGRDSVRDVMLSISPFGNSGKAAGLPVYKMLGAVRDRMPAYAMCGWYRDNDKDHSQYKQTINETLEIGYRAFKVKVGRYSLEDDAERIEVGRKTAGKDIRIMVDANQAFNRVERAAAWRVYQELGCFWYEEPLVPSDHEGTVSSLRCPGNAHRDWRKRGQQTCVYRFALEEGQQCCPAGQSPGGRPYEVGWRSSHRRCFPVELASHGGGPANMNILCAIPNAIYMESGGKQPMKDGEVLAPEVPGISSEVTRDSSQNTKSPELKTKGHCYPRLMSVSSAVKSVSLPRQLALHSTQKTTSSP